MDYMGYAAFWGDEAKEPLPAMRLLALGGQDVVGTGLGLSDSSMPSVLFRRAPFADTRLPNVTRELQIRPMGCVHGHSTLQDSNFSQLLATDTNVPVAPLFVKDLAGRSVYIGIGPHVKSPHEWEAYKREADVEAGEDPWALQAVTFPRGCVAVDGAMPGADMLEQVFFTKFRALDMGFSPRGYASGGELRQTAIYSRPNLYPYKLRLDTFYGDGWKLPQTQMLFARQDVDAAAAREAGDQLVTAWAARPEGEDYEAFVERMGGDAWIASLFDKGCTLVPTFEACNGYNVVGAGFELEDFWPGRAVGGLHEVVEVRADKAPYGTILEVRSPGFVTRDGVRAAEVVISDGSAYKSPHEENPLPLIPNLHLPHQRARSVWGTTWVPTLPLHFEPPALWGWEPLEGLFMQLSGPLWDPLHYYYASVDEVLAAFEKPLPPEQNRWLVPVPDAMKTRFYPVVPMKGFDTISEAERDRREEASLLPASAVMRVRDELEGAGVGYHPLPLEFEYELDPFWAPMLHPLNREHDVCPPDLALRLCPVVAPQVSVSRYVDSVVGPENAPWLKAEALMVSPQEEPLDNYPHLARYVLPNLDVADVADLAQPPFLLEPDSALLESTVAEIWEGVDSAEDLDALQPGLFDALSDMRTEGLKLLRSRHLVYREGLVLYTLGWWYCLEPADLFEVFRLSLEGQAAVEGRGERVAQVAQVVGERGGVGAAAGAKAPAAPNPRRPMDEDSGIAGSRIGADGKPLAALPSADSGVAVEELPE